MLRSADLLDGPNFGTVADSGVSPAGKIVVGIDHGPNGPVATIPDVHLLFNADYKRAGPDLILTGPDGKTAIVPDYFSSDKHATLLSPNGAMLTPDVVQALAGPQAPGQFAQATPAQNDAEAVGRVATVAGNCTILRNGVAITVNAGDAIHKGDVLQTVSGKMGVTFNDGSTLNLTENTRLVVNEFVFDPNGSGNKELLNIVQGSLTFISGQIAHNGDMTIDTPVATMGIRGTVGGVTGVTAEMAQMWITQSATGADVFNKNGVLLGHIAQDGPMLVFHAAQVPLQVLVNEVQKDAQQVAYELSALQAIIATQAIGQQLIQQFFQPNNPNPQSTDHPHTQIQLEFLNSPNHSADLGGAGGFDTSLGGTSIEVQVTTIQFDPVGNVIEDTTVTVPVTLPVDFAPQAFGPQQATTDEDQSLVFSNANVNAISVTDADTNTLTVSLSTTHGTLSLSSVNGLSFSVGDGTNDAAFTFSGSQADINAALNGLTFNPDHDYNGPAEVTYEVSDGNSSTGQNTVAVTVNPVNDAPVIVGATSTQGVVTPSVTPEAASYLSQGGELLTNLPGSNGQPGSTIFGDPVYFQPDYTLIGGYQSDDGSSLAFDITAVFAGGLNFFGTIYNSIYINNNGNITFAGPSSTYTPPILSGGLNNPIIAPFWADVDTRGGAAAPTSGGNSTGTNMVYYSADPVNHVITITWDDVGYYYQHTDHLNAYQLQLVDLGNGDFDIVFRYEAIGWTTGDASGGTNGLGGSVAHAGYSANGHYFEISGSGDQNAMLDLANVAGNTGVFGLDVFSVVTDNVTPLQAANGTVQFTDVDNGDTHTALVQAQGSGYQGDLEIDSVSEPNGSTPGAVDWHFSLTSAELKDVLPGHTITQTYDVTVSDGNPGGQATQEVAISWGSAAADTFAFNTGLGADTVLNFQLGTDTLDYNSHSAYLAPTMTLAEANHLLTLITSTTGDAVIDFHNGDTVTLAGVATADLQSYLHSSSHVV